jgi:hypothetical protein
MPATAETTLDAELFDIARKKFPPDEFVHVPDVCVFAEHETVDSHGEPQKYDQSALQAIIDKCNDRIFETENFAPLTDGHTPEPEDRKRGAKEPLVVGFVGPYKLGTIGKNKKKYAIFADEWRIKESAADLKRRPRRSVEVWMAKEMGERFFDPVAALGSETPRLDLGIKFARNSSGQRVEKYAAACAAFPASGSVFVKKHEASQPSDDISSAKAKKILEDGEVHDKPLSDKQKGMLGAAAGRADYEATESEGAGMIDDQDLQRLLSAINELDFVKWSRAKMAEEAASETAEETAEAGEYQAPGEDENGGELENAPPPPVEGEGAAPPPPPPEEESVPPPAGEPEEEEEDEYMRRARMSAAQSKDGEFVRVPVGERKAEREKYTKLKGAYDTLKTEHEKLKQTHSTMLYKLEDQRRTASLEAAAMKYALDPDEEMDTCLYSRGSEMTPKAFDAHMATIERVAAPSPVGAAGLPRGEVAGGTVGPAETEQDAAKYSRAIAIADEHRMKGSPINWQQAVALVEKENKNGAD